MDIIDVPLSNAEPRHHQTENHVLDVTRWIKRGEFPWNALDQLLDHPASLWINSGHTNAGHYDCISQAEAATVYDSLVLIRSSNFVIEIGKNYWTGKKSYRGKFTYNDVHYNLSMTDPIVRSAFSTRQEGDYSLKDVYLCISLTEPYEHDDRCHKLVAAIISNPPL